jgi:hypothetical protein
MGDSFPPALPKEKSATLSSTLSIKTPRTVLQKFKHDEQEPLSTVLSTLEASDKLASHQKHLAAGTKGIADAPKTNMPRMLPASQLTLAVPEADLAASDNVVLTPQVSHCCPLLLIVPAAASFPLEMNIICSDKPVVQEWLNTISKKHNKASMHVSTGQDFPDFPPAYAQSNAVMGKEGFFAGLDPLSNTSGTTRLGAFRPDGESWELH